MATRVSSAVPTSSAEITQFRVIQNTRAVPWISYALWAIVSLGFVTRVFSASKYVFTDEGSVFANTYTFAFKGTLIPANTFYPSFYALLCAPLTWVWSKLLVLFGVLPSYEEFDFLLNMHSRLPLIPSRMLSVVAGTVTIYVVYRIGKEAFGELSGLVSALFFSLSVIHVHQSGYGLPDILTSLFAACTVYYTLRALRSESLRDFVLTGVFVGLTTTTKYNGVLIVIGLVVVHLIQLARKRKLFQPLYWVDRKVLGSAGAAGITFLAGSPGLLLDFEAYRRTFVMMQGKVMGQGSSLPFTLFSSQIFDNLGLWDGVLIPIAVVGIVYAMVRGGAARWVLLSILLISLSHMSTWIFQSPHYFLFLTPVYSLLAGAFLYDFSLKAAQVVSSRRGRAWLQVILLALILFWPVRSMARYTVTRSRPDTREIALNWFYARVPGGAKIVLDWHIYQPRFISAAEYYSFVGSGDAEFRRSYLAPHKFYEGIGFQSDRRWLSTVEADYLVTSSPIYTRYIKRGRSRGKLYEDLLNQPEMFGWKQVRKFANGGELELIVFKRMKKWKPE